jgi:small subunit ribosomal protein S2
MSLEENKYPTLLNKPIRKNDGAEKENVLSNEVSSSQKTSVISSSDKARNLKNSTTKKNKGDSSSNVGGSISKQNNMASKEKTANPKSNVETNGNIVSQKSTKKVIRSTPIKIMPQIKRKNLNVGDVCVLKISALGPNGIGIDEYSYPFSIFVPNTNLKQIVKAKIVRVNLKGNKYAIAKLLKVKEKIGSGVKTKKLTIQKLNLEPNQILTVNIKKLTRIGAGLINLKYGYKLIVPQATIGNQMKVLVTRLKSKYGFAKLVTSDTKSTNNVKFEGIHSDKKETNTSLNSTKLQNLLKTNLLEGNKYTLTLPKKVKKFGTYLFLKLQGSIIFLKLGLNAKPGDKVRIKITKVKNKFVIAKIIQINPVSLMKKRILVRNNIRQMIQNGMHLGEKAVKCNARMKNYVWLKQHNLNQKLDGLLLSSYENSSLALPESGLNRGLNSLKDGNEIGQLKNKNEKIEGRPLIKKGNHIINLLKTRRCLNKALTQLTKYALKGRTFLFIGTKKAAAGLIARASLFSKNSFFVNTRWLGGLLTNWKTIRKSISKIRPILQEKQKIVADILEKRKRIKMRLIKKGLFIKNKTQLILKQGRSLLAKFKNPEYKAFILEKTKTLVLKQKELLENSQALVSRHKALEIKRRKVMYQNIVLKQHIANTIITRYNNLLRQLTAYTQKLRQLKYFLILSNELKKIKNQASNENTKVLNIDNKKIKTLMKSTGALATVNLLPHPPKDILNFILLTVKNNSKAFSTTFKETDFLNIETKNATTNKALLVTDFVSSLSRFVPEIKTLIQTYEENINLIKTSLTNYSNGLNKIKLTLRQDIEFHQLLVKELTDIQIKLIAQRNTIRIVKAKLNYFARQKRVIKFLPRLRHFKISAFKNKIISIVQILMRKIVDPKLKYPVDNIYDEKLSHYSKKIASARKKKWQRFEKYFGGIAKMTEMTKSQISKNVAIIIGQNEEMNAIRECKKLGIKMFNIVDTNCNPTLADHIIPANDDSRNSIKYVLNKFLVRIRLAQKLRKKLQQRQNKNSAYKKLKTMANQMRKNFNAPKKTNLTRKFVK